MEDDLKPRELRVVLFGDRVWKKMELDEIDGENGDIVACSWIGIGWVFGGLALLVYRQNETVLDFSKLNRLWSTVINYFFFFFSYGNILAFFFV